MRTSKWVGSVALVVAFAAAQACSSEAPEPVGTGQSALSTGLVIAEVYGGGGNSNAAYKNDFVVLFNRGTTAVSLNGLFLQYASATGSFSTNNTTLPNVQLQPGQYYLIQLASGGAVGATLPTPDLTDTTDVSASAGKFALTSVLLNGCGTTANQCALTNVIDLIGYGTTAQQFETAKAAAPSNTTSDQRKGGGCIETDDNSADFAALAPAPKNTSSTLNPCAADAGSEAAADATADVGADAPADVGSEASADATADVGSEASADATADVGSEASADATADVGSEASADATADATGDATTGGTGGTGGATGGTGGATGGTGGATGGTGGATGGTGGATGGTGGAATGGAAGAATGGAAGAATGGAAGAAGSGGGAGATGGSGGAGTGGASTGGSWFGGTGGKTDGGLTGGTKGQSSGDDGGCGCAVPGERPVSQGVFALLALGLAGLFRRRR